MAAWSACKKTSMGKEVRLLETGAYVSLYKLFVYFEAVVHESTIISPPPPPTCIAHPGAILVRPPHRPPVCCMLYTIQYW